MDHKILFSAFTGIVDLLHLAIYMYAFIYYLCIFIYLVSLVFSESGRLLLANGKDMTHKDELNIRICYSNNLIGVVSIAQLVEVVDCAL